jgi:hypothetical protein
MAKFRFGHPGRKLCHSCPRVADPCYVCRRCTACCAKYGRNHTFVSTFFKMLHRPDPRLPQKELDPND